MELLECLPLGVGHADEGVCLIVQMGPHRIMLDCGLSTIQPLVAEFKKSLPVDLALCTHAHSDHARGLAALHKAFPQISIYASEVTTHLLSLDRSKETSCQALPWRSPVEFREGLSAELFPSGHLPGAAAMLLTYKTEERSYKVFYTGDFLLSNSRLVDGLPLEDLRGIKPDVLIVEGSYGTARFPHRRQQENQLAERIHRAVGDRQSVSVAYPCFGIRTRATNAVAKPSPFYRTRSKHLGGWQCGDRLQCLPGYAEAISQPPYKTLPVTSRCFGMSGFDLGCDNFRWVLAQKKSGLY